MNLAIICTLAITCYQGDVPDMISVVVVDLFVRLAKL
jgi:hypothetical protein